MNEGFTPIRDYVINRLKERSFWIGLGLAASAAAVLPYPWNVLSFVAGFMGSLVPDGRVGSGS